MSRLTQPTILDGDAITAASLNDRFAQFTQSGTLNAFNTRDAAFDLPQFKSGASRFMAPKMAVSTIGYDDWKHTAYNTYAGQTTGASPHTVQDSTPSDTVLSLGTNGFQLDQDTHILRVYWDLSVRPKWTSGRPWSSGALLFTFPDSTPSLPDVSVFSGYGCWAFWLQWDVTDNTLTNFVNVPGQGNFNTVVTGSRGGNALSNCQSTSVLQNVTERTDSTRDGTMIGNLIDTPMGWTSVDGAWHHVREMFGPITVYGLRVVFSGPFGAHNTGGTNYLVRNDAVATDASLDVQAGSLQALMMRVK